MSIRTQTNRLYWSYRMLGLQPTLYGCWSKVSKAIRPHQKRSTAEWERLYQSFDDRYGVATGLDSSDAEIMEADNWCPDYREYEPTSPIVFAATVNDLPITRSDYTFVDYGCGKGRALFLAALMGFDSVLGVELSESLVAQARENLDSFSKTYRGPSSLEIHCENATVYTPPNRPTLFYFFNPFGPDIIRAVLDRIAASVAENPRPVLYIYNNPLHREVFDDAEHLRLFRKTTGRSPWLIYEHIES